MVALGQRFLTSVYRAVATSEQAFGFYAVSDARVVGLIACSTNLRALYRTFLVRYGLLVAPAVVARCFSPRMLMGISETLRYPTRDVSRVSSGAEILNFCVDGDLQGRGIGRGLFTAAMEEFRARGATKVHIVTGANQVAAQRFYGAVGATLVGAVELHAGIRSNVYSYSL